MSDELSIDLTVDEDTKVRLLCGHAWVLCLDCGEKIAEEEGTRDRAISCPNKRADGCCGRDN